MVFKIEPRNVSIQSNGSHRKTAAGAAATGALGAPKSPAVVISGFKRKTVPARVTTASMIAAASASSTREGADSETAAVGTLAASLTARVESAMQVTEPPAPVVSLPQADIGGAQHTPAVPKNRRAHREAVRQRIDLDQQGFLRLEDVLTLIPVSRATWYAGVKDGVYPSSVQIGKRAVAWRTQDIKALIDRLSGTGAPAPATNTLKGVPTP